MIAIVDYGMGNLRSVQKALERVGADARIVNTAQEILTADKVVLPGVGAFADAIERIRSHGLDQALRQTVSSGKPMLGICLGLQMLFDVSYEDGVHQGLGIFPGSVRKFDFSVANNQNMLSVPHMGWNQIRWNRDCPCLKGIDQGQYVYFCHSYYVVPKDDAVVCTTTDYGTEFVSSIWKDNVFATQFHPEKSQAVGLKILENFARG